MNSQPRVTLYHAPNTRSSGTLILLEELGAPYDLQVLNMKAGEQRQPAFLAINPMGKVPALVHDGALVSEQGAIYLYLADLYPAAGLAPQIGDPLRGPYLRWMVYYGSSFEPALVDRALKRSCDNQSMLPYGNYETTIETVIKQLERGPYMLGARFSALDVLWGTALTWTLMFGLVPEVPVILDYVQRLGARPSVAKVKEIDAALVARQESLPS